MNTLEILDKLIAFRTVSTDSNLALIDFVQDYLTKLGFEVHRIDDETGLKAGLFARIGPTDKAGIMLSGHTDVVPTTGQKWTVDPFKMSVANGKVYGRGTTDMKGYLASVLAFASHAAKVKLNEPLKIAFSYDEEIGCVGIKHMIKHLKQTIGLPRYCFVGEPTSMQVAIGHKGKAALRATCHGMSGHSALAPNFLNAVHLATDFISELRDLQNDYALNGIKDNNYSIPYSTFHVGKLAGGVALNIVPDKAVVDFEYRHLANDSTEIILAKIHAMAQKVTTAHQQQFASAKIDVVQYNDYPALETSPNASVVEYAQKLTEIKGATKVAFGTEAGCFSSQLGIPTIVCGPGSMEKQGHQADEYIETSQLAACDAMFHRLLNDLSGIK